MIRGKNGVSLKTPPGETFTKWGDPNERFQSQYGFVTYRTWCEKEVERMKVAGKTVVIRTSNEGDISLEEVA